MFEAIGVPAVQEQCLEATRPGGTLVLVGLSAMGSGTNFPGAIIARQEKTVTGSYYGTANTAREVKGGKFTGRIFSPVTVTGYVPEILSNITMIANDFELEPGTCGKGHKEYVPVTSGGPHIRTRARCS